MDFAQLLQATAATPQSRARPTRPKASRGAIGVQEKVDEEEEWDLVDDAEQLEAYTS
jgi:hypothetical protein